MWHFTSSKSAKETYSKTCVKRPLQNKHKKDVNDNWELNEGRTYYRMLALEHSTIHLTCTKR